MEYFGKIISYENSSEDTNEKVAIMENDQFFKDGLYCINVEFHFCKFPGMMQVDKTKIKLFIFGFNDIITGMFVKFYVLQKLK
jgi:hypothetical protein